MSGLGEGFLLAGQIGKPHGLGGEVYVIRISDDPSRFEAGSRLTREDGDVVVVERARPHRDRFLVKFEGCDTREAAERLRGALYVEADALRELDEGEYWERDLIGCEVVTEVGESIGKVAGVVPGPAQDLLEIDTGRGLRLVPMVAAIVTEVDVPARRIVLDAPAGLLD